MTKMKFMAVALSVLMLLPGCGTATKNGALIGAGGGAAVGALVGRLIGKNTAGTLIGAGVGAAVGTGAGLLIGKKMDKAKAAAQQVSNATVETVKDANGLDAIKVSFDNGILFQTGKSTLQATAQNSLKQFAQNVLNVYTDCDCSVYGFASSDGSDQLNLSLSQQRANAVANYLKNNCAVSNAQIKYIQGFGEDTQYLVYKADGTEDREASRRVEVYLYASESMIKAAEAGTLK
ncbi:MAG: OmpA family protein [Prevotella sp.]|nr:OmpA family protein [Prevotella sp.]